MIQGGKQKIKKPWPTKKAMQQVYANQLWGSDGSEFYSGEGSHQDNLVQPYVEAVTDFLRNHPSLTVLDVGCGDFNVGRQIMPFAQQYTAVDIVPELINRNRQIFQFPHVRFECLDLAQDALPQADVLIVRQVLQHLSNAEIMSFVNKLNAFTYVILTEHLPNGTFTPNVDIISGQGIRLKKKSGVNLQAAPFSWKPQEEYPLVSVSLGEKEGKVVTTLFKV